MHIRNEIKFFLRKFGIDISRYNFIENFDYRLKYFLDINNIDCVIDIGANIGQYAKHLRRIGFKKNIISFEPLNHAYKILENKSKKDSKWQSINFGIGDKDEISEINISKNSYSSSILEMSSIHSNSAPDSIYLSKQKINIKKLDNLDLIKNLKYENIFLKVDAQGYEDKVINGSINIMDKIKGLQIEMSLKELYKGQVLFDELYKIITNLNFELWDIKRGYSDSKSGKILQLEAIFKKING